MVLILREFGPFLYHFKKIRSKWCNPTSLKPSVSLKIWNIFVQIFVSNLNYEVRLLSPRVWHLQM